MREAIQRRFGVEPRGLWLTERVWEADLAADLATAGVRFALVDDRHFLVSGFERDALHAPFWTESDGKRLALFPIDERLRYLVPFQPPAATAAYLRELHAAGQRLAVLVDDGEKWRVAGRGGCTSVVCCPSLDAMGALMTAARSVCDLSARSSRSLGRDRIPLDRIVPGDGCLFAPAAGSGASSSLERDSGGPPRRAGRALIRALT